MARVVPLDFRLADPEDIVALREKLDFMVNVDPGEAAASVARELLKVVTDSGEELQRRYRIGYEDYLHHRVVRARRVNTEPLATVSTRNFVVRASGREWLAMDPTLAWVYKCALTSELAERTAYTPTTDQVAARPLSHPSLGQ
ncbi:DUF6236 family protein [Streptomyces sp. NPDC050315]|uniref:DUF6236 family protein n=1 Tax=Streptomyces sp. NPDC050315 TaxID=3155039 RepID=UPI00343F9369